MFIAVIINRKCWDAEIENRPTTKELYQILTKWDNNGNNELYSQIKEFDEIGRKKFYNRFIILFKSGSADTNTQSESANPNSECLDVQLSELELNEIYQDNKNDIE
ncbi:unnamed protein product [Rhizophagus irregularis]|nr:unnamed protein product [Rhizophagus irregularis]